MIQSGDYPVISYSPESIFWRIKLDHVKPHFFYKKYKIKISCGDTGN
jgi:hypothetical protein